MCHDWCISFYFCNCTERNRTMLDTRISRKADMRYRLLCYRLNYIRRGMAYSYSRVADDMSAHGYSVSTSTVRRYLTGKGSPSMMFMCMFVELYKLPWNIMDPNDMSWELPFAWGETE